MPFSDDAKIEHLALRLIDARLLKSEWTHQGHFAAALWLSRHRPDLTAPDEIRRIIMRHNDTVGTANSDDGGYHNTITLASMRAAADMLARAGPGAALHEVLDTLIKSPFGHRDWLLSYWRRKTLFSVAARRAWIEPDRAPLPF